MQRPELGRRVSLSTLDSLQLGCQYIVNLYEETEIMQSNIYIRSGSVLKYQKV